MIFVSKDINDRPLFTGFVNGITERKTNNGGVINIYRIGTSEKMQDGSREYSTWFCTLMGNARKECEATPLQIGDKIGIYSFKQTNVSRKGDDGSYSPAFLNVKIVEYKLLESANSGIDEDNPF